MPGRLRKETDDRWEKSKQEKSKESSSKVSRGSKVEQSC